MAIDEHEVTALRRRLLAAVRRCCPGWLREQAEDITQEALIKVCRVLEKKSETDPGLPASYINKAAYHATVDAIRRFKQQGQNETPLDEIAEASLAKTQTAPAGLEPAIRAVQECLAGLLDKRQQVVTLRLQGHSIPEIGRLLGWKQSRANNLVYRGLSDMRECLRKKGVEP